MTATSAIPAHLQVDVPEPDPTTLSPNELRLLAQFLDRIEENMGETSPDGNTYLVVEDLVVRVAPSNGLVRIGWDDGNWVVSELLPVPEGR